MKLKSPGNREKIYMASPLGFAESTKQFMDEIEHHLSVQGYQVVNPWKSGESSEYAKAELLININTRRSVLHDINMQVASRNESAIRDCNFLIAVLEGVDVDSGTASEIGFAYGLEKKIYGLRTDTRRTGDNDGALVNLQVQYWIENSGGFIANNLSELRVG